MSPMDQNNAENSQPRHVDRDLLISRVIDDAASAQDWDELRALAEYDPSVWRELFEAQHTQAELAQAVQQAIAVADGIDAPVQELGGSGLRLCVRQVGAWAGWAVAASVGIFWMASQIGPLSTPNIEPEETLAGVSGTTAPDDASTYVLGGPTPRETEMQARLAPRSIASQQPVLDDTAQHDTLFNGSPYRLVSDVAPEQLLAQGAVGPEALAPQKIAEMPDRVLLEVRRLPNGQLELIYVRQLIEKAVMNESDLYQVKPDDAGIERTVPYRTRRPSSGPV